MELRPYQTTAVAQITAAWSRAQRVMYQLATGAGKTVIATTLCQQHLGAQPASRVVGLTHRRELRAQSAQQWGSQGLPVVDLTTVYPAKRTWLPSTVSLISPGLTALQPLLATAGAQDLLVVDEAHHSVANSWATFIAQWPGVVLGLTGTLWRMSLQEGFGHLYDELICGPSVAELIQQGYLSDFRIVSPQSLVIRGQGRAADGDYAVGATEQANSAIFYSDLPIQAWEEAAASDLRFEEAWRVPSNRSLRHESGTCVVRPVSPRDPNSWKVGYRAALTHMLQWQHPYHSFQEAWQAGQHYLAHPQSPPPGPEPVPEPVPLRPTPPPPEPSVADPQVRIRLHYGELELEYEGPASYLDSRLQPICAQLLALSPAPPPTQSSGAPAAGPGGSQRPETENHTAKVWSSEIVQGNS